MYDIKLFENKLFKKAKKLGFEDCEIYFEKEISHNVKIFKQEVSQYKNSNIHGLSFRGIYNNKLVYAYTEKIKEDIIDSLLISAKENSKITEKSEDIIFIYNEKYPKYIKIENENDKKIEDIKITLEEKIDLAKNLEKLSYEESKYVKNVNYCSVGNNIIEKYLSNTKGINLKDVSYYCSVYLSVTVEKDNDIKVADEIFIDRNFNKLNINKMSKNVVDKALKKIGSRSIKSGKYNVIFKNDVFVDILSTFVPNFYAETIQNGFSLLKDKIGKIVASNCVNIYDNIYHCKSLKYTSFDSEAVPTQDKVIVKNGVLKNYLYNLKSSRKDNKISTGNGFRNSFKSSISTSHLNFYIKEGKNSFDDIIKILNNGILITNVSGLHSGANVVSGDFSFISEGFLVENGKIKHPINQITVASNFYNLLKNIFDISDDLYFDIPNLGGSIGSPSILVKDINISGV